MKQNIHIIQASRIYFRRVSPFRTAMMKVLALKGQERAIVSQTNAGTVSKATLGKLLRDGVERTFMDFSEPADIILNWTELSVQLTLWKCSRCPNCPKFPIALTLSTRDMHDLLSRNILVTSTNLYDRVTPCWIFSMSKGEHRSLRSLLLSWTDRGCRYKHFY